MMPSRRKSAERVAAELLAAANRAIKSASFSNKGWDAYVELYDAMSVFHFAVAKVARLSVEHQVLRNQLGNVGNLGLRTRRSGC